MMESKDDGDNGLTGLEALNLGGVTCALVPSLLSLLYGLPTPDTHVLLL